MSTWIGMVQKLIAELGPWYLQQQHVGSFLEAVGLVLDGAVEQLVDGMRLGQPLRSDVSALPVLSRDRRVRIYETEPEDSQRYRLSRFWQLRRQAGTHQGEMRNVQPFFLPGALPVMRIVHQAGDGSSATWHTLASDGSYSVHRAIPSNWDWDGVPTAWSRWWAIVYTDGLDFSDSGPGVWDGDDVWDGDAVWDGTFTDARIADMVDGFRENKSAHSKLWGMILATDPASFDPTASVVVNPDGSTNLPAGNWGFPHDLSTGEPTREQSAVYALDLGQA